MKKLFALLLLFALPCSLFACGSTEPPSLPEGMQIAEQGDGYTFYAPEDWTVDVSTGIPMAYVSAVDTSNITLVRVLTEAQPADYFETARTSLASRFDEFLYLEEQENNETLLGGMPAIVRMYSGKLLGVSYTVKQYLCRKDAYLYLFTYTAKNEIPSGEKTYFERYEELADKAAAALAFQGEREPSAPPTDVPPVTNAAGMTLISDPAVSRYSMFVPTGWESDLRNGTTSATRAEGAVLTLSYEIPMESTLQEHWATRNLAYASLYEGYTLLTEECSPPAETEAEVSFRLGGQQAAAYVFRFTSGGHTYKCRKLMTVRGVYVYTLSYTALYEGEDTVYDRYLGEADAVASAFIFD